MVYWLIDRKCLKRETGTIYSPAKDYAGKERVMLLFCTKQFALNVQ
uniref:Transposase IS4 family n=1 Tax=Escherichia albertii TaxID=208962 RepID=A0A288W636_ESCAL|nr:transposase IS4 family [Escherichia albertii]ARO72674.1 transposase IS4 family [Escherichia albertii]ARO72904.1 transposase IS4 family [Escherichia albertii]ARO73176.1 transposase IS4 family [Escherichia albertii]ARO73195.1 transposase IS4 family [Escherichia albertii]